ncbi:MAG: oxidoreductase [Microbacteriaceae bacterium]|nr:oxidoreductase [Microbacteriaceae bacterium]MCL2794073.1 oxidoreductase [Microbacteriaceae bacterium]
MTLYDDLGGFDAILAVCHRWNALCLADPVAEHPFSRAAVHPQHDERLAAYLSEAAGGPKLYTGGYGSETKMQRMHAGNGPHPELDEICLRLFDQALAESPIEPTAAERLGAYFREATQAMTRYDVSADLVPRGLPLRMADGGAS